jgi:hypothetical protein
MRPITGYLDDLLMRLVLMPYIRKKITYLSIVILIIGLKTTVALAQCMNASLPWVALNTQYSDQFNLIINPKYANLLTPTSALGLEIAFGGREFRMGATWASMIGKRHRIKLTAEYLSENILFFLTALNVTKWNTQHAFGINYQYLVNQSWLHTINLATYHAYAGDADLSQNVVNNETNYRIAAGSNSNGISGGFTIIPGRFTAIVLDLYYDQVNYRTQNQPAPDSIGIGESITLEQLLAPRLKLLLTASHRQPFDNYDARLSWLALARPGAQLELSITGQYLTGNLPQPRETRVGLMVSYHWHVPCRPGFACSEEILQWTTIPAVRIPQTLVTRDEKSILSESH